MKISEIKGTILNFLNYGLKSLFMIAWNVDVGQTKRHDEEHIVTFMSSKCSLIDVHIIVLI